MWNDGRTTAMASMRFICTRPGWDGNVSCPQCDALELAAAGRPMRSELPPLTREPIREIDATPDDGYVFRILRAYRDNCDCRWVESTDGRNPTNPLLLMMNEHNRLRAALLDAAIARLLSPNEPLPADCSPKSPEGHS